MSAFIGPKPPTSIPVPVTEGGTAASTAPNARTNLGLAIGTDVQAFSANLTTWAGKTAPAGTVVGTSDTQALTNKTIGTTNVIDVLHQNFFIHDNADTTKKLRTDVSRITTATTRSVGYPDADGVANLDNYTTTATDYTVLKSDKFIEITSTAAARTMTLPSAGTLYPGKEYIFIDGSGGAATNNIIIKNSGGTTIATINTNGGVVSVTTDITNWRVSSVANLVDIQAFTSGGTWTKPSWAKFVYALTIAPGGGGGSGRRGTAGDAGGGASGCAGGLSEKIFTAQSLSSTVTITVGTGGAGGAAQTVNSTDGNNGADGSSDSSLDRKSVV